jgi:tetratricopeptide (TPR) repeat protein
MMAGRLLAAGALVAALWAAAGCEPTRTQTGWVNPLDAMEAALPRDPKDNSYILRRMEFGRTALMLGCPLRAKPHLLEAFEQLGAERDNTAAALTTEQLKFYKGETYERAMLAAYLGLLEYQAGDYNTARILLMRALSADRAAVVKDTTPSSYGEDFGFAFYWIGRTFARLNDADQCAIALRKAAAPVARKDTDVRRELSLDQKMARDWEKKNLEGEQWAFQTFTDPKKAELRMEGIVNLAEVRGTVADSQPALPGAAPENPVLRSTDNRAEFFTPAYQGQANTVLNIEVGRCPFKYLGGISGERTEFGRLAVPPRTVRVYVDGHDAGQAFEVLDLWDQAATQDRIFEKDAAQFGKALMREVLRQAVGSPADLWKVEGDVRHWTTLPGKVFVFAAALKPGVHTVRLEMYDVNGALLPRWTNTYYGLPVPQGGETCLLLKPFAEGDNQLPPDLVRKAVQAGAKPYYECTYGF